MADHTESSAGASSRVAASLEARDLAYRVAATRILDRVSISAGRGEFVGLIGPNGAGKSTLLKAISGLLRPDAGEVVLEGRDLSMLSQREVARVMAQVPQTAAYTYGFTSMEVVVMGRYPHMSRFQVEGAEDRRVALEAMRQTETEAFADRAVTTLSGGERQRVFVARALAQAPHVLLLDEPTANLDIHHQLKVLDLVRTLVGDGVTAIAAIHDLALAARYCHRLVLLDGGRVVAEGPAEDVLTPVTIEEAFGVCAVVYRDALTDALSLSILGPSPSRPGTVSAGRVHVVCGGGSGTRLLFELTHAGFTVTAGVLGAGDTDRVSADVLGIEYVPVPAFGAIDDEAHARHRALAAAADVAVLADVPIGRNNLRNLEALTASRHVVCVESAPLSERDFTEGVATRAFEGLGPVPRYRSAQEAAEDLLRTVELGEGGASEEHAASGVAASPDGERAYTPPHAGGGVDGG